MRTIMQLDVYRLHALSKYCEKIVPITIGCRVWSKPKRAFAMFNRKSYDFSEASYSPDFSDMTNIMVLVTLVMFFCVILITFVIMIYYLCTDSFENFKFLCCAPCHRPSRKITPPPPYESLCNCYHHLIIMFCAVWYLYKRRSQMCQISSNFSTIQISPFIFIIIWVRIDVFNILCISVDFSAFINAIFSIDGFFLLFSGYCECYYLNCLFIFNRNPLECNSKHVGIPDWNGMDNHWTMIKTTMRGKLMYLRRSEVKLRKKLIHKHTAKVCSDYEENIKSNWIMQF